MESVSSSQSYKQDFPSIRHALTSLAKINSYFLEGHLTDVVLIAGKHRIPSHRLVLSASSEYFAAMFRNALKEASQSVIELKDVDGNALVMVTKYCYTGKIELNQKTVQAVLATASFLQVPAVVEASSNFLANQLHPSNCIGIRRFADLQCCANLLKASENYIAEHFLEVMLDKEFLSLSSNEIAEILASDVLNVPSEETVFMALASWLEHGLPHRKEHLGKLLRFIRFPLLSPSFIVEHVENNKLFRDNPECLELMYDAFKCHFLPEHPSVLQSQKTFPRRYIAEELNVLVGRGPYGIDLSVERYNVNLNKWTVDNNLTVTPRIGSGIAVLDGKLYIVESEFGRRSATNPVICYDLKTKTYANLPSLSIPRRGLRVAVLDGSLYAVGGGKIKEFTSVNTVERFDLKTNNWSQVTPMSTRRVWHGMDILNGKLYVVGGYSDQLVVLRSVECYDPRTDRWMDCASLPAERESPGVGVLNGYLYVVGGASGGIYLNSVERYDPSTDQWETVASMRYGREGVSVYGTGGKLFAVGGRDDSGYLDKVEVYDPLEDTWHEVAPLSNGRAFAYVTSASVSRPGV